MTVINFQPKQEPAILVCEKCFAQADAACGCGVAYRPAGKLAVKIVKRFPNMSSRDLAEKFGIGRMTVQRAREKSGVPNGTPNKNNSKIKGRDGKHYVRKAPKRHRKSDAIVAAADAGLTNAEVAEQTGISPHVVRREIEREKIRQEQIAALLDELGIDPSTLSKSAKAKLEIAKRLEQRKLQAEYAERMDKLNEEVKKRVFEKTKTRLDMLNEMEAKARDNEECYRRMINNHESPLTISEWRTLVMIAHDDPQVTAAKKQQAARVLVDKKLQLTGQK